MMTTSTSLEETDWKDTLVPSILKYIYEGEVPTPSSSSTGGIRELYKALPGVRLPPQPKQVVVIVEPIPGPDEEITKDGEIETQLGAALLGVYRDMKDVETLIGDTDVRYGNLDKTRADENPPRSKPNDSVSSTPLSNAVSAFNIADASWGFAKAIKDEWVVTGENAKTFMEGLGNRAKLLQAKLQQKPPTGSDSAVLKARAAELNKELKDILEDVKTWSTVVYPSLQGATVTYSKAVAQAETDEAAWIKSLEALVKHRKETEGSGGKQQNRAQRRAEKARQVKEQKDKELAAAEAEKKAKAAEKEKKDKEAAAKAEKERKEKEAVTKAEKEKRDKETAAKVEKERKEKEALAKAEKEKKDKEEADRLARLKDEEAEKKKQLEAKQKAIQEAQLLEQKRAEELKAKEEQEAEEKKAKLLLLLLEEQRKQAELEEKRKAEEEKLEQERKARQILEEQEKQKKEAQDQLEKTVKEIAVLTTRIPPSIISVALEEARWKQNVSKGELLQADPMFPTDDPFANTPEDDPTLIQEITSLRASLVQFKKDQSLANTTQTKRSNDMGALSIAILDIAKELKELELQSKVPDVTQTTLDTILTSAKEVATRYDTNTKSFEDISMEYIKEIGESDTRLAKAEGNLTALTTKMSTLKTKRVSDAKAVIQKPIKEIEVKKTSIEKQLQDGKDKWKAAKATGSTIISTLPTGPFATLMEDRVINEGANLVDSIKAQQLRMATLNSQAVTQAVEQDKFYQSNPLDAMKAPLADLNSLSLELDTNITEERQNVIATITPARVRIVSNAFTTIERNANEYSTKTDTYNATIKELSDALALYQKSTAELLALRKKRADEVKERGVLLEAIVVIADKWENIKKTTDAERKSLQVKWVLAKKVGLSFIRERRPAKFDFESLETPVSPEDRANIEQLEKDITDKIEVLDALELVIGNKMDDINNKNPILGLLADIEGDTKTSGLDISALRDMKERLGQKDNEVTTGLTAFNTLATEITNRLASHGSAVDAVSAQIKALEDLSPSKKVITSIKRKKKQRGHILNAVNASARKRVRSSSKKAGKKTEEKKPEELFEEKEKEEEENKAPTETPKKATIPDKVTVSEATSVLQSSLKDLEEEEKAIIEDKKELKVAYKSPVKRDRLDAEVLDRELDEEAEEATDSASIIQASLNELKDKPADQVVTPSTVITREDLDAIREAVARAAAKTLGGGSVTEEKPAPTSTSDTFTPSSSSSSFSGFTFFPSSSSGSGSSEPTLVELFLNKWPPHGEKIDTLLYDYVSAWETKDNIPNLSIQWCQAFVLLNKVEAAGYFDEGKRTSLNRSHYKPTDVDEVLRDGIEKATDKFGLWPQLLRDVMILSTKDEGWSAELPLASLTYSPSLGTSSKEAFMAKSSSTPGKGQPSKPTKYSGKVPFVRKPPHALTTPFTLPNWTKGFIRAFAPALRQQFALSLSGRYLLPWFAKEDPDGAITTILKTYSPLLKSRLDIPTGLGDATFLDVVNNAAGTYFRSQLMFMDCLSSLHNNGQIPQSLRYLLSFMFAFGSELDANVPPLNPFGIKLPIDAASATSTRRDWPMEFFLFNFAYVDAIEDPEHFKNVVLTTFVLALYLKYYVYFLPTVLYLVYEGQRSTNADTMVQRMLAFTHRPITKTTSLTVGAITKSILNDVVFNFTRPFTSNTLESFAEKMVASLERFVPATNTQVEVALANLVESVVKDPNLDPFSDWAPDRRDLLNHMDITMANTVFTGELKQCDIIMHTIGKTIMFTAYDRIFNRLTKVKSNLKDPSTGALLTKVEVPFSSLNISWEVPATLQDESLEIKRRDTARKRFYVGLDAATSTTPTIPMVTFYQPVTPLEINYVSSPSYIQPPQPDQVTTPSPNDEVWKQTMSDLPPSSSPTSSNGSGRGFMTAVTSRIPWFGSSATTNTKQQ